MASHAGRPRPVLVSVPLFTRTHPGRLRPHPYGFTSLSLLLIGPSPNPVPPGASTSLGTFSGTHFSPQHTFVSAFFFFICLLRKGGSVVIFTATTFSCHGCVSARHFCSSVVLCDGCSSCRAGGPRQEGSGGHSDA